MKKLLLILFNAIIVISSNAQTKIQVFDKVLFFDGYGAKVDTPSPPAGIIRHQNYLYARKMNDEELASIGSSLQMKVTVKASCDNYDRIGNVNMALVSKDSSTYNPKEVSRIELGRFITPFMNKNIMPDSVPYLFDINNVALLMKDTGITNHFNIWIELEIFGVPYAANTQVAGCGGRNDVFFGSLVFITNSTPPVKSNNVLIPMSISANFNNYQASATDTVGKTTRTFQLNIPKNLTDASFYLITSNHGSNSGGEEYNRRNHFVYVDDTLKLKYKPGRTTCEPFRMYNTQANGIYGQSPRTASQWQSFSNWCPGDNIDIRRIDMGPMPSGVHRFKIEVPSAVFTGGQGNFPLSVYLHGKTSGKIDNPLDTVAVIVNPIDSVSSTVKIYPSPVSEIVTIEGKGISAVMITDQLDRIVYYRNQFTNEIKLNCSRFPSGVYFVRLTINGQIIYKKFVVGR